ncbi:MAG: hypothetical protein WBU92_08470 [Candidatus Dormiibacterota bacterium]
MEPTASGSESGAEPTEESTAQAIRCSYVHPDPHLLAVLLSLSPLIEMGAGTGYWANQLRRLGADIIAFDHAPPGSARANRYHPGATVWTEVLEGTPAELVHHPQRTLFVCWPPLFSSLADCLDSYLGPVVAWLDDGGVRTVRPRALASHFELTATFPARALETAPGTSAALNIWIRRTQARP